LLAEAGIADPYNQIKLASTANKQRASQPTTAEPPVSVFAENRRLDATFLRG
jgi:hypothetical protein